MTTEVHQHSIDIFLDWLPCRLFFQEYDVADYFNLSREVVALSMSLFDRFMATRTCEPSSDLIRLVSIATLHISIKMSESCCIKLSTLAQFGKGNVSEAQIIAMELLILTNVRWLANPPTAIAFVLHLVHLLPEMTSGSKRMVIESSRFLAGVYIGELFFICFQTNTLSSSTACSTSTYPELSVADSYFIGTRSSIIGMAAVMHSIDECCTTMSPMVRTQYLNCISAVIGASHDIGEISTAQKRLRLLFIANGD
jgi:hypothetical protein